MALAVDVNIGAYLVQDVDLVCTVLYDDMDLLSRVNVPDGIHLFFIHEKDDHVEIIRFNDKGITRLQPDGPYSLATKVNGTNPLLQWSVLPYRVIGNEKSHLFNCGINI
tara:strand:+ start:166 stop:492 length:327 start_codon:yes stop_codon:yes gene_type:complete